MTWMFTDQGKLKNQRRSAQTASSALDDLFGFPKSGYQLHSNWLVQVGDKQWAEIFLICSLFLIGGE